ncbi:ribosome-binding factor A [Litoreibacter janthinus]|uniref:Ribosome-binding factor A n=2 Tax=Litoreibacter janthinus TaxID=670154 RepID=A0A1I6G377_9RHOB|nr:ribosome-binding factor A [Litoreibacter janthinus]
MQGTGKGLKCETMAKNSKFAGAGPSQRQLRVGELIRRTLSETLSRGEIHDPDLNRMSITVSEVRVTPDLRIATAFVLPLGGKDKEEALAALARNKGEIRHLITKQMSVKHSPDIRFMLDDTFDRMDETNRLFASEAVRRDLAKDDDAGAD